MTMGVDDATASETSLLNEVNHPCIVLMSINTNVAALCSAPVKYGAKNTSLLSLRGDAMNSAVG